MSQLAEQHRHQLCTATETLRRLLRLVFLHQSAKFQFRKMLQQLIKQTHCLYHRFALLLGIRQPNSSVKKVVGAGSIIGGLTSPSVQAVLDTSETRQRFCATGYHEEDAHDRPKKHPPRKTTLYVPFPVFFALTQAGSGFSGASKPQPSDDY